MGEFFLRLIGAPPDGGGGAPAGASLGFHPAVPWWVLAVALVLLAGLSAWLYARTPRDVGRPQRVAMAALRGLFFALLLAVLLRPVLDLDVEREVRRTLVGALDTSGSFAIRDAGDGPTRLERAVAGLAGDGLLERLGGELDLALYAFDGELAEVDPRRLGELEAGGASTALGNALRGVLERRRGEALAGVLLVTDGVSTTGENPLDAAQALRAAGVPVFVVGVGEESVRDLAVESVEVAPATLVGDAVPVAVKLRARGMAGETVRVELTLAGAPAASEEVVIGGDGRAEVPLAFLPNAAGDFELAVEVEPAAGGGGGEVLVENNRWSRSLRVLDSRIRVLMVEEAPRWEFKYIQAMLLRERRVDLDCVVFEADPEVARAPGSPYIESFPQRREDLFKYDLVVFGDVDPRRLTPDQVESLTRFVAEAGGSLAVLAGKRFTPAAYRYGPLAAMLPVEPAPPVAAGVTASRPLRVVPTAEGADDPMLQLADGRDESLRRWQELPPVYWTAGVARVKPAAEVLLAEAGSGAPVVALQRYGAGEVLFVGTDNTWRWRKNTGELYHSTFWGQVVQRLAGGRLSAGSRRSRLRTDRQLYEPGGRVTVYAKLANAAWDPLRDETVRATLTDADGRPRDVLLRAVPNEAGQYRAEFAAPAAGRYRLAVASDPDSAVDLTVRDPAAELRDPALDADGLRQLASATGGRYFSLAELGELPAAITERSVTVATTRRADLWASPLMFLLLVGALTAEWVMRKFAELK